jgi:pyruvate kinase
MVHMPVELINKVQRNLIIQCHKYFKPVIISCNVLESMVSSVLPTSNEASDISNLVAENVDCITLIGETAYG